MKLTADTVSGMCGIYFSCNLHDYKPPSEYMLKCLRRRGPDSVRTISRMVTATSGPAETILFLMGVSSVLSLRGISTMKQPLEDSEHRSDSFLCWNGEAWKYDGVPIRGFDVEVIFRRLLEAASECGNSQSFRTDVYRPGRYTFFDTLSNITGPYAFVFYDAINQRVFYGRDVLGRRSLLIRILPGQSLEIASVRSEEDGSDWNEVPADGLYMLDLTSNVSVNEVSNMSHCEQRLPLPIRVPWATSDHPPMIIGTLVTNFADTVHGES